jgi:hypothetical protein
MESWHFRLKPPTSCFDGQNATADLSEDSYQIQLDDNDVRFKTREASIARICLPRDFEIEKRGRG